MKKKSFIFNKVNIGCGTILLAAAMFSCTASDAGLEDLDVSDKLHVNVGIGGIDARSVIDGATFPTGSTIGLAFNAEDGKPYDNIAYTNVAYTATGEGAGQTWDTENDILLSATKGTLYAYYPFAEGVNITTIPIDCKNQYDYMWGTPVTGICDRNAKAQITMNHVLTAIILTVKKDTYTGEGKITEYLVYGDGIGNKCMLDAMHGTLYAVEGQDKGVTITPSSPITITTEGLVQDMIVVPASDEKNDFTIKLTIDGEPYTAKVEDILLQSGYCYSISLVLSATELEFDAVNTVDITYWNKQELGDGNIELRP